MNTTIDKFTTPYFVEGSEIETRINDLTLSLSFRDAIKKTIRQFPVGTAFKFARSLDAVEGQLNGAVVQASIPVGRFGIIGVYYGDEPVKNLHTIVETHDTRLLQYEVEIV